MNPETRGTFVKLFKLYWFAALATLLIWILSYFLGGVTALTTVAILTLLEVTFSADNAVVNSTVLVKLSPFWRSIFLTVGILIAVFVVRFMLPITVVMIGSSLSFNEVVNLAFNNPASYAEHLQHAAPIISSFGGTFLLLIALSFFIDYQKETHWLKWLEPHLGKLGRYENFNTFVMLTTALVLYLTVDPSMRTVVLLASICSMILHSGLGLLDIALSRGRSSMKHKVGWAAFVSFLYLEVLDASFSLDGVVGAFAITSNVVLIMLGLGAGAVWVRSMTVHMVRTGVLKTYIFLENGAHWAIAFLGSVMLLELYHIELPEWVVGSAGLFFVVMAVIWSRRFNAKQAREA